MSISEIVTRGHEKSLVKKIENLLYISEYKRRQSAPGVKVSQKNFGRDRRYPITNLFRDKNWHKKLLQDLRLAQQVYCM